MKTFSITWKSIIFGLLLVFTMSGVGHGEPKPIRIGFVADFSSITQSYSHNSYKAAQIAIENFNSKGGLLGRPVQLVRRDGGNDPERHYQHVIDLARDEKIVAVFGGASTPCVLKASAACKEQGIPYLSYLGNSQSIVVEKGHPYVFMFQPNTRMEVLGFSIFTTLMPWKRYAWIGPDYAWGHEILRLFKQSFKDLGVSIEWTAEAWHPLGNKDYSEAIKKIIDAKPDALVVATWGEDLRHFVQQADQSDLFNKMAAFGWFANFTTKSERILSGGIWTISRGPLKYLASKYPQTEAFVKSFNQKFNDYPSGPSICCYDSLLAWKQAVLYAGSANPAAVAKALKGMSFIGLRGKSFIRAIDGQMNAPTFFGRLVFSPEYPTAVIESVIEIPASKTWLTEKEVQAKRLRK